MDKKYKITLSDGTIISDLTLNGNNFISKTELKSNIFEGNCSPVVINDGTSDETHSDMELVQITTPVSDEWWFVLRDLSISELSKIKMQSDIEYIAMMSSIEL